MLVPTSQAKGKTKTRQPLNSAPCVEICSKRLLGKRHPASAATARSALSNATS